MSKRRLALTYLILSYLEEYAIISLSPSNTPWMLKAIWLDQSWLLLGARLLHFSDYWNSQCSVCEKHKVSNRQIRRSTSTILDYGLFCCDTTFPIISNIMDRRWFAISRGQIGQVLGPERCAIHFLWFLSRRNLFNYHMEKLPFARTKYSILC